MRDKIFISYRRDDARWPASMLYDRLAAKFGKRRLFMDVDTIAHGQPFPDVLKRHLGATKVMLVVIGPEWARLVDARGQRRLDNPDDFVRMEVAEGLKSAEAVIPVLVDGAELPRASELPEDIAPLTLRQKIDLRQDEFAQSYGALERSVGEALARRAPTAAAPGRRSLWPWAAAGVVVAGLLAGGLYLASQDGAQEDPALETEADAPLVIASEPEPEPVAVDVASAEPEPEPETASDREIWLELRSSEDIAAIAAFLSTDPEARFADAATDRLEMLAGAALEAVDGAAAEQAAAILGLRKTYRGLGVDLPNFDAASAAALSATLGALAEAHDQDALMALRRAAGDDPAAAEIARLIGEVDAGLLAAQGELRRLGLYQGALDGIWGGDSQAALRRFEAATGRVEDGALSRAELDALKAASEFTLVADGAVFSECEGVCPEMVVIPEGRFTMGSPETEEDRDDDEGPQRAVAITRFALSATEITFDQWAACVADGYCQSNPNPDDEGWGRGDRPVINVSWNDITGEGGFLDWLNWKTTGSTEGPYRLPSEAEWEYAARAGSETRYSFGNDTADLGDYAWYLGNSDTGDGRRTHPVGLKLPNAFGLYDMHGNVYEWVEDCWHGSYDDAPPTGVAWMEAGGGDCSRAVLRGGSWIDYPFRLRSAYRIRVHRVIRNGFYGFRVARTIISP